MESVGLESVGLESVSLAQLQSLTQSIEQGKEVTSSPLALQEDSGKTESQWDSVLKQPWKIPTSDFEVAADPVNRRQLLCPLSPSTTEGEKRFSTSFRLQTPSLFGLDKHLLRNQGTSCHFAFLSATNMSGTQDGRNAWEENRFYFFTALFKQSIH